MTLSPQEIAAVTALRRKHLGRRDEFMALANEVCDMLEIPFSKISGVTRGNNDVCAARNLICKLAVARGFSPGAIARFIKRDRTTVVHALAKDDQQ